ncbi:pseudouridine-5'-phosphatase-like isoform X2 [Anticarsia gemmatalis]
MYGGTDRDICKSLVKELGLNISPDALESELEQMCLKALPRAPLHQGAERLLIHLRDNHIPVALATNSTERTVHKHVEARPKLFGIFHHMVCVTDPAVYRGKPYPDLYIVAADRFPDKPKPCKCLVFEDSNVGLKAGISAGMQVVLTPHRPLELRHARKATLVLRNLLDFQPELFGLPPFADTPQLNKIRR